MPWRQPTRHVATLVWAALLAFLLLTPLKNSVAADGPAGWIFALSGFWMDILAHFVLLGVMSFLATKSCIALGAARPVMTAAIATILYGVVLEVAQSLIPGRSTQPLDLVVNTAAVVSCAWLAGRLAKPR